MRGIAEPEVMGEVPIESNLAAKPHVRRGRIISASKRPIEVREVCEPGIESDRQNRAMVLSRVC